MPRIFGEGLDVRGGVIDEDHQRACALCGPSTLVLDFSLLLLRMRSGMTARVRHGYFPAASSIRQRTNLIYASIDKHEEHMMATAQLSSSA